ncbi:hypothetical protein BDW71DRAFT_184361 [Aspergillus fruticulosus]
MVSFSCEACGDVLTKKKLDPHRNQCRGASFTCIDCMVHFQGTSYRSHTVRITLFSSAIMFRACGVCRGPVGWPDLYSQRRDAHVALDQKSANTAAHAYHSDRLKANTSLLVMYERGSKIPRRTL